MSVTMYTSSVPALVRQLIQMQLWLDKAGALAETKKFDSAVYLAARLAPDMLPLVKQIQIACDGAKFCAARLAGVEAPKFDDAETTLAELRERIGKTIDFLRSVAPEHVDGTEDKDITIPVRQGAMTLKGEAYLQRFALPNFYFHATTTYALLRHYGVELGKMDYLGPIA